MAVQTHPGYIKHFIFVDTGPMCRLSRARKPTGAGFFVLKLPMETTDWFYRTGR
jgi:hypothetical protein